MLKVPHFATQKGFTLIELMVALVLGLIVVAAAVQLFIGGMLSSQLQQANADIQDSGLFGLDYVVRDIRLLNQDNLTNLKLDDQTAYGGVVLTGSTASNATNVNFVPKISTTAYIDSTLLSRGQGDAVSTTANYWKGLTAVTLKDRSGSTISNPVSDQLTIQFIAPTNMANCEGANVLVGDLVVERYFVRADTNGTATDYALACDASTPSATAAAVTAAGTARTTPDESTGIITPQPIAGLGDSGQIIIPRVDHFHVLLGAMTTTTNTATTPSTITKQFAYYTIPQYRAAAEAARSASTSTVPVSTRILSVQVSVLVRSVNNAKNREIDPTQPLVMFDQTATPADTSTRYQRRVYSTTIALRNAMGESL